MEKPISILYIGGSADVISALTAYPQISLSHESNAMAATNFLRSGNKLDAVLCDLNLSGGDGFEMHDFLRKERTLQWEFRNIVFILLCQEF